MLKNSYNGWDELFLEEFNKPYFKNLKNFLLQEYATRTVYPPKSLILNAFDQTPYDKVKVVILGQDPYYNPGQAMGMSFSVNKGVAVPKSLQNMFKEIADDIGRPSAIEGGDLTPWARRECCCSAPFLPSLRGNQTRTKAWAGKLLPTP